MSEKKGLKQSRLPFQIITSTSPKVISEHKPASVENSSPKTPVTSRKRKQSTDGENIRLPKIGRTNSKENIIAEQDAIEIVDSSNDNSDIILENKNDSLLSSNKTETTPTTSGEVRKIKIGRSCSKNNKRQAIKPVEIDPDDSVVYIDETELKSIKKGKKSVKKSEKKKLKVNNVSKSCKKSLNLNDETTKADNNEEEIDVDEIIDEATKNEDSVENEEKSSPEVEPSMTEDNIQVKNVKIIVKKCKSPDNDSPKSSEQLPESSKNQTVKMSDEISKLVDTSIENGDSLNLELNDDIVDVLTDDEKNSPTNLNASLSKTTPSLTPKALARRKEQESKRIEKEMQRQRERDEKEKQRVREKEMREEAKKKEREEKEEMRKKEKEEKEKKRLAEIEKKEEEKRQKEEERKRLVEQKEEEKRAKEEEKRTKEEERRQKEEERRQKEEERKRQNEAREEEKKKKESEKIKEEERKKKAAEAFSKFFVPSKKKSEPQVADDEVSKDSAESFETTNFMPFQIHGKMRLAPRVRSELSKEQKEGLEYVLKSTEIKDVDELYLKQLKSADFVAKFSLKTWPDIEEEKDDIVVVDELEGAGEDIKEDEAHLKMKHRAKLLMFKENRRPAYYGTWRKQSKTISARRPFAHDSKYFDYEADSDEEWEEEEPGESIHGSDSEKEKEKDDDDYEVDDDFFVPHGHLSEDEMQHDDEIMEDNSPETQKAKLKVLQQEFAAEMKKKTEKIKPRLIGCIWMNGDEDENGGSMTGNVGKKYHCSDIIWRILKAREMLTSGDEIKMEDFEPEIVESEEDNNNDEKSAKQQKPTAAIKVRPKLEGESVKELIRLLHVNVNSKKFLIKEYQAYRLKNYHKLPDFIEFSTKSVEEKFVEISSYKTCPEEGPLFGKKCWYVKDDIIRQYFGDEELPMPNQWTYILEKEKKVRASISGDTKKDGSDVSPNAEQSAVPESPKPSKSFKITSFVKSSPKTPSTSSKVVGQSPKTKTPTQPAQKKSASKPSTPTQTKLTTCSSNQPSSGKKRVALLMSVKPGQSIDVEKKNLLVNKFMKVNQNKEDVKASKIKDVEIIEIID